MCEEKFNERVEEYVAKQYIKHPSTFMKPDEDRGG